jgi:hypothetical protein
MALAEAGICPKIIVTDVNAGPLARARQNLGDWEQKVAQDGTVSLFDFRLGDGLEPIAPAEVDVAVIAGMGGELMTQILSADVSKTRSVGRYILQPRKGSEKLRRWIDNNRYCVVDENLVREGALICEVLVMETGKSCEANGVRSADGCGANDGGNGLRSGDGETCGGGDECGDGAADGGVGYEVSAALLRRNPPLLRAFVMRKLRIEREILAAVQEESGGAARARAELTVRRIAAFERLLTKQNAS